MKKTGMLLLTTIFLFGCATGGGIHSLRTDLNQVMLTQKDIKKEIKELRTEVNNIKSSLANLKPPERSEMVIALRESQLRLQAQLQELTDSIQTIQAAIDEMTFKLETSRKDTEAEIEALRVNIESINNEINNLRAKLETLSVPSPAGPSITPSPAPEEQPPASPEAMYKKALQMFNQGKIVQARKAFQTFLQKYPEHELADNAQFWIGETYYKEGNYEEAILAYDNLLKKYPNSNKLPEAMLKQAYAFANIGDVNTARVILKALLKKFPNSDMASYAEKKLKELGE